MGPKSLLFFEVDRHILIPNALVEMEVEVKVGHSHYFLVFEKGVLLPGCLYYFVEVAE